jgi:two-component system response regulator DevR
MTPIEPGVLDQLDPVNTSILRLIAEGLSNREIADRVFLSYQTVRNRVSQLFDATGAGHRLRHDPRAIAVLLGWLDRQRPGS